MNLKERLHGMLLYAPALNYVYPYYQKHLQTLPSDVRNRIEHGDSHFNMRHTFGSAILKKDFAEDSRQHEIDLSNPVPINCSVRIMHGLQGSDGSVKNDLGFGNITEKNGLNANSAR